MDVSSSERTIPLSPAPTVADLAGTAGASAVPAPDLELRGVSTFVSEPPKAAGVSSGSWIRDRFACSSLAASSLFSGKEASRRESKLKEGREMKSNVEEIRDRDGNNARSEQDEGEGKGPKDEQRRLEKEIRASRVMLDDRDPGTQVSAAEIARKIRLERQHKGNHNSVRDTSSSSSDDDELGGGLPGESRINSTRILMNNHETGQRRVPQFESSRKKSFIAGASRPESAIARPHLTDTLSDEDTLSLVSSIGSNSTLSSLSPKKQVAAMGRGGWREAKQTLPIQNRSPWTATKHRPISLAASESTRDSGNDIRLRAKAAMIDRSMSATPTRNNYGRMSGSSGFPIGGRYSSLGMEIGGGERHRMIMAASPSPSPSVNAMLKALDMAKSTAGRVSPAPMRSVTPASAPASALAAADMWADGQRSGKPVNMQSLSGITEDGGHGRQVKTALESVAMDVGDNDVKVRTGSGGAVNGRAGRFTEKQPTQASKLLTVRLAATAMAPGICVRILFFLRANAYTVASRASRSVYN